MLSSVNKWKRSHISYCHERWEKKKKTPSAWRLQQYEALKLRVNGRIIVGCYMLRPLAHPVACLVLLGVVAQSLKPARTNGRNIVSQQLSTFLGVVASVCVSLTFQKKNRRANLRFTEKLLLGLQNHNSLEAQSL